MTQRKMKCVVKCINNINKMHGDGHNACELMKFRGQHVYSSLVLPFICLFVYLPVYLRQGPLLNLELAISDRLTGQ